MITLRLLMFLVQISATVIASHFAILGAQFASILLHPASMIHPCSSRATQSSPTDLPKIVASVLILIHPIGGRS